MDVYPWEELELIKGMFSFQGQFCTLLYVAGTMHSVLIKEGVLISGVSFVQLFY